MNKTSKQIQGDIYRLLRGSSLGAALSGAVYRSGYRQRDSAKEDAVVTFTAGLPGQVQSGVVTVSIYVPDIDPCNNGIWQENGSRMEELESMAAEWVESIRFQTSEYKFRLQETIHTEQEESINQHFIVIKLHFQLCND